MVTYKTILTNWHQGKGGGSVLSTIFEGCSDGKLERLGVDIGNYDHTDVAARPTITLSAYVNQ